MGYTGIPMACNTNHTYMHTLESSGLQTPSSGHSCGCEVSLTQTGRGRGRYPYRAGAKRYIPNLGSTR